jgi:hypothetical protein
MKEYRETKRAHGEKCEERIGRKECKERSARGGVQGG